MNLDVLAFGAHPDDIEIFSSGTLYKCVKNGLKVGVVDLTKAELSTRGNPILRAEETEKATKILQLIIRDNLEISDGHIEINQENKLKVITSIRKYKPKIIFIPYFETRHPDHKNTGLLVKEAAYYSGLEKIRTSDEEGNQGPHRPSHIFYMMEMIDFNPTFIVDITEEFDVKVEAIKAFKSQFFDEQNMDKETYISKKSFIDFIKMRSRYFGFKIGVEYGEPFFSPQPLAIKDLKFLL